MLFEQIVLLQHGVFDLLEFGLEAALEDLELVVQEFLLLVHGLIFDGLKLILVNFLALMEVLLVGNQISLVR